MNKWMTKNGYLIHQLLRGRSNSFLVIKDDKALLVDTGRKGKRAILAKRIDNHLAEGASLVSLILTHTHFDHAENAAYIKDRYRVPVLVHKEEAHYLKKGENPPVRGSFYLTKLLAALWEKKLKSHFRYEPVDSDNIVEEKLSLDEYGFDAYLLHTPGHSPGSMSLIVDNEIAIVGDAMFGVIKRLIYPPFADNPKQMIESWGKLLETGCTIFLPAHGTANSALFIGSQYKKYSNPVRSHNKTDSLK